MGGLIVTAHSTFIKDVFLRSPFSAASANSPLRARPRSPALFFCCLQSACFPPQFSGFRYFRVRFYVARTGLKHTSTFLAQSIVSLSFPGPLSEAGSCRIGHTPALFFSTNPFSKTFRREVARILSQGSSPPSLTILHRRKTAYQGRAPSSSLRDKRYLPPRLLIPSPFLSPDSRSQGRMITFFFTHPPDRTLTLLASFVVFFFF